VIGELNFGGVFISSLAVWAVLALALNAVLGRVLNRFGIYRIIWHRALFDIALFVILWAVVADLSTRVPPLTAPFR
jgi:hypothetical protein